LLAATPAAEATASSQENTVRLFGTVTEARSGDPIPGAALRVRFAGGTDNADTLANVNADEAGQYEFALPPGTYEVSVTRNGFVPAEPAVVSLDPGSIETRRDFELSSGALVAGRVTEGRSSVGAKNVPVVVMLPDNQVFGRTETDEKGYYELGGLIPGSYQVTLRLEGTEYKPGEVLPFERITINDPREEKTNVNFSVQAAGVVWGYVTDVRRNPVPNTRVVLCTSDSVLTQLLTAALNQAPPVSDSSEDDGYYELLGVPLNKEWKLYATSDDHSPQLANPFILTETNRSVRVDVYMFGGSDVSGRVVDGDGNGIPAAQVRCIPSIGALTSPMNNAQAFRDTRSDTDGYFAIDQLSAGTYQILAHKEGYKFALTGEPLYPDGYSAITGIILTLDAVDEGDHACFGTVTDSNGQPLDSVEIRLEGLGTDSMSGVEMTTSTGADGGFRFDGLETGVYQLRALKEGFAPYNLARALLDKENKIIMQTTAAIRGRVITADGRDLVQGFTVSARPASPEGDVTLATLSQDVIESAFNDPDGYYEIYVPAGNYQLEARAPEYTPGRTYVAVAAAEEVDDVDITLPEEGGRISGQVVTITGGSPQGATVILFEGGSAGLAEGGGAQEQRVGEDGAFTFENLPTGTYTAIARHESYANGSSGPINVTVGQPVDGVTIALGQGGVLVGRVLQNGRVMANAMVIVGSVDTGTTKTVQTDENGDYQVDGLGTGMYQVAVTTINTGGFGGMSDAFSNTVQVTEGQVSRLDFGAGGIVINGRTTRPPAPSLIPTGYAVLLPSEMGPLGSTINLESLRIGRVSAINMGGEFTFQDVYPGSYFLQVFYADGALQMETLRAVYTDVLVVEEGQPVINMMVDVGS
jgi:hypothetical protein